MSSVSTIESPITPAYHRVRNTGVIRSDRNPSRSSGSRTVLGFSVTVFRLAGSREARRAVGAPQASPQGHLRFARPRGIGRTHTDAQVAAIAASIKEWGWTTPTLVGEDGGLIAGHARVLAARQLGIAEIPVMVAAGWSEAQKRAYVLADNQ